MSRFTLRITMLAMLFVPRLCPGEDTASAAAPLVIGETRRVNVHAPPGYADSPEMRVPVLYMPDGGMAEDFLHIAGLVEVSVRNGTMRPFLLVGIENTVRRRDLAGPTESEEDRKIAPQAGGSAKFRAFLRDELMPEIGRRYRTTDEAAIVGESLAGLFVVETFLLEPDLFDTYVAIDPSLWWNDEKLVDGAPERLRAMPHRDRTLYLASSSDQGPVAERFAEILKTSAPTGVTWHHERMPEEAHATIFHPAALRAFRAVLGDPSSGGPVSFPTSDGGSVEAHIYGKGTRAVVLAHGGRFDKESWAKQARALAQAGFLVLAIDFRGYGRSTGPGDAEPMSAPLHLDVLAAVRWLREQGATSVSVVGASMGGTAAAQASVEAADGEIDRLVLLASGPIGAPERMKGHMLFVIARDDPGPRDEPRLPRFMEQYERAPETPERKELLILEGAAHAQFLFDTDQGDRLLAEILRFLSAP